jgi:8-oxo-dGTP diphosphatase
LSSNIHNSSRAIIISEGNVLLTHPYGKNFIYLPGGHIEQGETAFQALERELHEELDIEFEKLKFQGMCGIIESNFPELHYHEISFIFMYELEAIQQIDSKEAREDFIWHHVTQLDETPLFPSCLKRHIPEWVKGFTKIPHQCHIAL